MIDTAAATLAFRNRALSVVVATTGVATLASTADGYTRAAGSFATDGFVEGQEVIPVGFADTTPRVVTAVSALLLSIDGGCNAEVAGAGRSLTSGLPALQAWDNSRLVRTPGRPYVTEQFVPATSTLLTVPANGGYVEETGLYVLSIYGLENRGMLAIRKLVDALKRLFTPGTALSDGTNPIRIRGDTSVRDGQITPRGTGWATCVLTIPWRARSVNTIAA